MRTLLVEGDKTFKIDIPDDAKVTYGPWAPPKQSKEAGQWNNVDANKRGTLRIYKGEGAKENNIIACFAGVTSFRELTLIKYSEQVAREEGATIWKDDEKGYMREDKRQVVRDWVEEPKLIGPKPTKKGKSK